MKIAMFTANQAESFIEHTKNMIAGYTANLDKCYCEGQRQYMLRKIRKWEREIAEAEKITK